METSDVLADRVDAEPPIFRGCSSSELAVILALAAVFWLPAGIFIGLLFGALTFAVGIAAAGITGSVVVIATAFRRIKAGRPDGYHQQRLVTWLHDQGFWRSPFIRRSGHWDLGRTP
jgi:conjugative transfer region protein (TIGR03750 family)